MYICFRGSPRLSTYYNSCVGFSGRPAKIAVHWLSGPPARTGQPVPRARDRCPPAIQAEMSLIAHCVSGTAGKKVQVSGHSDIHKIYTLTIALL